MQKIEAVTDGYVGGDAYHYVYNDPHKVSLTAYRIGTTEVTQELYELVMAHNPSYFQGSSHPSASGESQEKRPVEQVSWFDAIAFCNELTRCCYSLGEAQCVYTYNGHTYTVEDAQAHNVPVMDMRKKRLPLADPSRMGVGCPKRHCMAEMGGHWQPRQTFILRVVRCERIRQNAPSGT